MLFGRFRGTRAILAALAIGFIAGATRRDGRVASPSTDPSDSQGPRSEGSAPSNPGSPKLVGVVRRYAVAEFAALIGIPLTLVGLALTVSATRDTARQLESSNRQLESSNRALDLAKQQAQPILRLISHPVQPVTTRSQERYDRLALEINGQLREAETNAEAVFILSRQGQAPVVAAAGEWWRVAGPESGEIGRWVSKPALSKPIAHQNRWDIFLLSVVEVTYVDVLGQSSRRFFMLGEIIAGLPPYTNYIGARSMADGKATEDCFASVFEANGINRLASMGNQSQIYTKLTINKSLVMEDLAAASKLIPTEIVRDIVAKCLPEAYPTSP